jgi:hypothetical protein
VGFISISFNLDVLYRTADREFFLRFSTEKMRSPHESFLTEAQSALIEKRDGLRKQVAKQEGELDAEIRGLRQAPQGYGRIARREDYQLTLLQKTTEVELDSVSDALAKKEEADALLRTTLPRSIDEVEQLQNQLRVVLKDISAVSGVALPQIVKTESPLFAVFEKLSDWRTIGIKEIFFVIIAFFLDLGDIIGYSLIPNRPKRPKEALLVALPEFEGPDVVLPAALEPVGKKVDEPLSAADEPPAAPSRPQLTNEAIVARHMRRPFKFRRE